MKKYLLMAFIIPSLLKTMELENSQLNMARKAFVNSLENADWDVILGDYEKYKEHYTELISSFPEDTFTRLKINVALQRDKSSWAHKLSLGTALCCSIPLMYYSYDLSTSDDEALCTLVRSGIPFAGCLVATAALTTIAATWGKVIDTYKSAKFYKQQKMVLTILDACRSKKN